MTIIRKYRFALIGTKSLRGRKIENTPGPMTGPLRNMEIARSLFPASRVKA